MNQPGSNHRGAGRLLGTLVVLALVATTFAGAVRATPCDDIRAYRDALAKQKVAEHDLRMLGHKGRPPQPRTNQHDLQQEATRLQQERDKAFAPVTEKQADVQAARQAILAFRSRALAELAPHDAKIKQLEPQIKAAETALAGASKQERQKIIDFRIEQVNPLQAQIRGLMPGAKSVADARQMVDDPSFVKPVDADYKPTDPKYRDFSSPELDKIKADLGRHLQVVRTWNTAVERGTEADNRFITTDVNVKAKADADREIPRLQALLPAAYDKVRATVRVRSGALLVKEQELQKLEQQVYGGQSGLIAQLPQLRADLAAAKQQKQQVLNRQKQEHAPLMARFQAAIKARNATRAAAEKQATGLDAKIKATKAELAKFPAWDRWIIQEQATTQAAAAKVAYDRAVADKDAALTRARADARAARDAYNTQRTAFQGRQNRINTRLAAIRAKRAELAKRQQDLAQKGALTAQAKQQIAAEWAPHRRYLEQVGQYRATFAQEQERSRNQAADRIEAARAALQEYDACFSDVQTYRTSLNTAATGIRGRGLLVLASAADPSLPNLPTSETSIVVVNATFPETVKTATGTTTRFMTTARLRANFRTGTITGTLRGSGTHDQGFTCYYPNVHIPQNAVDHARVRYNFSYTASVSGRLQPSGFFQTDIRPTGNTPFRLTQRYTHAQCTHLNSGRPPGSGPLRGDGLITGTVERNGAAYISTTWDWTTANAQVTGTWRGGGTPAPIALAQPGAVAMARAAVPSAGRPAAMARRADAPAVVRVALRERAPARASAASMGPSPAGNPERDPRRALHVRWAARADTAADWWGSRPATH